MSYNAYITTLKNVRKHPNADRLQLGECFGNTVCVSMDYTEGEIGIYFPCDGQLSYEFANANNLLRKMDENGKNIGGYMDADKRNVTAIKLRGEKSDGLFLPLSCLEYTGVDMNSLNIGDTITSLNGHEICCKYIPRQNVKQGKASSGNKTRKTKANIAPLFAEHADTEQLAYNLGAFKAGDEIEITLKMHGTSQRTAYMPTLVENRYSYTSVWKTAIHKILPTKKLRRLWGERFGKAVYEYGYVSGTRRTVLENYDGGYYGSNEFREQHSKFFEGKLNKGETVYYEVVGFTHTGAPIMPIAQNKKLNDKAFVKQYGETTTFSYGCEPEAHTLWVPDGKDDLTLIGRVKSSDIYVYRMTMTNEDGFVVEYTPDFMRYRCEQMGVKTVPVMWKGAIPEEVTEIPCDAKPVKIANYVSPGQYIKDIAEQFYDGPDPIGKTHVREGVVVRILNRPKFCAYKCKNWSFKALEGIVKVDAVAPDMEEAESTTEMENGE